MTLCSEDGCIALAVGRVLGKTHTRCAVHARGVTQHEREWLAWANHVPRFTNPLDLLVRRDPPLWLDRYEKKTV